MVPYHDNKHTFWPLSQGSRCLAACTQESRRPCGGAPAVVYLRCGSLSVCTRRCSCLLACMGGSSIVARSSATFDHRARCPR